jgi:hypothetical protein
MVMPMSLITPRATGMEDQLKECRKESVASTDHIAKSHLSS